MTHDDTPPVPIIPYDFEIDTDRFCATFSRILINGLERDRIPIGAMSEHIENCQICAKSFQEYSDQIRDHVISTIGIPGLPGLKIPRGIKKLFGGGK